MPKHELHRKLNRIILGKEYQEVNKWMDEPSNWLGKRHRRVRHDPISVFAKYGASKQTLAGILHIFADTAFSEDYGVNRSRKSYRKRKTKEAKRKTR